MSGGAGEKTPGRETPSGETPGGAGFAAGALAVVALLGFFIVATLGVGAVFVGLTRLGAFAFIEVMFYRGLVNLALAALLFMAVAIAALARKSPGGLAWRDAVSGAVVGAAVNLAFFIVVPVTVDRSISVFMLSQFEAAERPLTETEVRDRFVAAYVDQWRQLDRRLAEQTLSGNLRRTPEGWTITPQGRAFMKLARSVSRLFAGDRRFVNRKE